MMKASSIACRAWPTEQPAASADAGRARRGAGARASNGGSHERPARGQPVSAGRPAAVSADSPRSAGQRFSALLESPAGAAAAARSEPGVAQAPVPWQAADGHSPLTYEKHGDQTVAHETLSPALRSAAVDTSDNGPRSRQAPPAAKATLREDDVGGLLDEVADLVCLHRSGRAQHWSVSVWLREAVLRDTQLALSGEPGRIDIRFSSTDTDSLRRLHAGRDELQARLHARIVVPHLHLAIESAHEATQPDRAPTGEHD
jgi:Type III secretion protein (HpaP)